jgi:Flp pilus assembly protein protease CpaA
MISGFLFWLFFIGILIASFQDLKRREIDNWLNLFLIFGSLSFIIFKSILEKTPNMIIQTGFFLLVMFIFANLFYYGRVFAGGDAKLLFAMTVFFLSENFYGTFTNIFTFIFLLMISGSIYGLGYSFFLYSKDFKEINKEMKEQYRNPFFMYFFMVGVAFFIIGFVKWFFIPLSIIFLFLPLIYVFSKGLEKVSMIKTVSGKELREGDWLVNDVRVGKKLIRADWDGLSSGEVSLMSKLKNVKIKDGLPFAPAFLIAFLAYFFLRTKFLGILINIF